MTPESRKDIDRIVALWTECRERFGGAGSLLFGRFTIADAFFAPVVMRFHAYAVKVPPRRRRSIARRSRRFPRCASGCDAARGARPSSSPKTSPTLRSEGLSPSAERFATSCSACRSRNATTSWSAPRPKRWCKQGFKPVGKDFPVFLHPKTHEEYALARTERKSGRGYKGFTVYASPEVTLEEDLKRRDLTINAIAKAEDGTLIDPFQAEQGPARRRAAARERSLRRRPGAHPARRALRRALRFRGAPRNHGADAAHGRVGRGRLPRAGARVAGVRQGPGRAACRS